MWRALFLALGVSLVIIGAQCLVLERVVLASGSSEAAPAQQSGRLFRRVRSTEVEKPQGKQIVPPDWAPWSLMGAGAVVMLYSFTIPRRVAA